MSLRSASDPDSLMIPAIPSTLLGSNGAPPIPLLAFMPFNYAEEGIGTIRIIDLQIGKF